MTPSVAPELILLVDDDPSVLRSLRRLLTAEGFQVRAHASAAALFEECDLTGAACVLVDLGLPDLGGLDVQARLFAIDRDLPVVFLSGQGDVAASVRAMKAGAVDFLTKPVEGPSLMLSVRTAVSQRARALSARRDEMELRRRASRLSLREAEVLAAVAKGLLNKQIAAELCIVEHTVKLHRAHGFEKLGVRSIVELLPYVPYLSSR
jgi:FixJ family two-component response regulator